MARYYVSTVWTAFVVIFLMCSFLGVGTGTETDKEKSSRSLYSSTAEEPVQHLDVTEEKPMSSLDWIKNYIFKYVESRLGTSSSSTSNDDLSNSVGEGRQMPTQSSLGDAIAVGGLGLLFINQLAVALNLPFLLPFMLIPVALLTIAVKLLSNAGNDGNDGMVTQILRSNNEHTGWDFQEQPWQTGWVIQQ